MINRSRLEYALIEYIKQSGVKPDLITVHPENMAEIRKEGPTFNGSKGYNEIFGIEIISTYKRPKNTIAFFTNSQIVKVS